MSLKLYLFIDKISRLFYTLVITICLFVFIGVWIFGSVSEIIKQCSISYAYAKLVECLVFMYIYISYIEHERNVAHMSDRISSDITVDSYLSLTKLTWIFFICSSYTIVFTSQLLFTFLSFVDSKFNELTLSMRHAVNSAS